MEFPDVPYVNYGSSTAAEFDRIRMPIAVCPHEQYRRSIDAGVSEHVGETIVCHPTFQTTRSSSDQTGHLMTNEDHLPSSDSTPRVARSTADIQDWLVKQLADELQIDPGKINVDQPILAHGIDSMHVVAIVAKLEDWLGVRFSSDPLEDHPSVEALSRSLARRGDDQPSVK